MGRKKDTELGGTLNLEVSSIVLGFLWKMSRLSHYDVTSLYMQLKNIARDIGKWEA